MLALLLTVAVSVPTIGWNDFFARVTSEGIVYSDVLRRLDGHRVRLRGYSVRNPTLPQGILLTHFPYDDPHEVEEIDVPFDAVAVFWRHGVKFSQVPGRPTVEGVLHLGNRNAGPVIIAVTLEDATPVYPEGR